jgi:hypothetical protein
MKPPRHLASLAALVVLAALPASASAATLTAHHIRVAGHTGYVRVVVDFSGAPLAINDVNLAPGSIDAHGLARFDVTATGATTTAAAVKSTANVSVLRTSTGLRVRISTAAHRFKFVSYTVLHSPERLVIDLFRRASRARLARGGCLKISNSTTSTSRKVMVRGVVTTPIFENTFRVRLRGAGGRVVAAKTVTTATPTGPWSKLLRHRVGRRQTGLIEAIVFSAKDGAVQCLYQRPVTIRP